MKLSADQSAPEAPAGRVEYDPSRALPRGVPIVRRSGGSAGSATFIATAIPISVLMTFLQGQSDRMVIDNTNLTGLFDIQLQYTPDTALASPGSAPPSPQTAPPLPSAPSLFTALQEQLGLKLDSARATVQVLVIDSAQKPESN